MKYFNVCSKETTSDGNRHLFHKVGVIKVTQNGGWYLRLNQYPETKFQVFPSQNEELPAIEA